jgi:hypothetical protein
VILKKSHAVAVRRALALGVANETPFAAATAITPA